MTAVDKENDNIEVMVIDNPGEYEYQENYETDTEKEAIVKQAEALCRASMEYSDYIAYLRSNVGMDACAFFNNISKANSKKIRIEVHHAPLTLFDIIKLVLDRAIRTGDEINPMLLAEEATRIHYMNQVGLIPLSKTLHEVVQEKERTDTVSLQKRRVKAKPHIDYTVRNNLFIPNRILLRSPLQRYHIFTSFRFCTASVIQNKFLILHTEIINPDLS